MGTFNIPRRYFRPVRVAVLTVLTFLLSTALCNAAAFGEGGQVDAKRVLIISSYSLDYPYEVQLFYSLKQELTKSFGSSVKVFFEGLDLLRLSSNQDFFTHFAEAIRLKYADKSLDLVIVHGGPAADFVINYGKETFDNTAAILITYPERGEEFNDELPEGYVELQAPIAFTSDRTARLILALKPRTKQIYVVSGTSPSEQTTYSTLVQALEPLAEQVDILPLNHLAYPAMLDKVSEIRGDAAILFTTFLRDALGESLVSYNSIKEIAAVANVPVFSCHESFLGTATVGGYMGSTDALAKQVVDQALQISLGRTVPPQQAAEGAYQFDSQALKRWGIRKSALPEGSIVKFETISSWQRYKWYVLGGFLLLCLQTYLIIQLSVAMRKRKQAEQELARLERLNLAGEMAAALAHEIRNPMTVVRGYLQLFQTRQQFADHRQQTDMMIQELDRANAIITEFLSLARTKTVNLIPGDLNNTLQGLYPLLEAEALLLGHELELQLGDIPNTTFDDGEIRQLVLNMARNGMEAMDSKGQLSIKTYAENAGVVLAIQDNGRGIPIDFLQHLGTPFMTTKDGGTGLGLSVCYRVAERHNATIEIETSRKGTTFYIKFPVAPDTQGK